MSYRESPVPLKYLRMLFALAVLFLLGWFIGKVHAILLPFVFGILVAYLFDPLADRLERYGLSRTTATSIILFLFFSIFVIALVLLVPPLVAQLASLIANAPEKVAALERKMRPMVNRLLDQVGGGFDFSDVQKQAAEMSQGLLQSSGGFVVAAVRSVKAIANIGALLVIAPVVSFYFLRDFDAITAKLDALLPRYYAEPARQLVREMDRVISGFLRGQLNVCLALAVFYAVALSIAQLKYALLLSLMAGVLIIIPYAGTFIAGCAAVAVAYFTSGGDVQHTGIVLGIFVFGQMIEGYVLAPKLMGNSIGLHPMWIIFGMLSGGALLGFVGVLIAVPVTAVIGVLVRALIRKYLSSGFYSSAFLPRDVVEPETVPEAPVPADLIVDPPVTTPSSAG